MKLIRLLPVALIVLALAAPVAAKKPAAEGAVFTIAHRGASGLAPEHTFAAYDLAMKMKATYIEQDLQMTADGVLVSLHDGTLDRTASGPAENCTGAVGDRTLAQLRTCEVGSWFNERYPDLARPEYAGQPIPTLEEVFQRYGKKASFYIETKSPEEYPGMEEELLRLLDQYGLREPAVSGWKVLIQSFSPPGLLRMHDLAPELPLIQLLPAAQLAGPMALDLMATYAVGIGPSSGGVDAALVEAAHARCLEVHPYTVNEAEEMQRLIDAGVDGMFTNFPNVLRGLLGKASADAKAVGQAAEESAVCRAG